MKIKKINWYNINGFADHTTAEDLFRSSTIPYKVLQYDSTGNLVRENGYDRDGKEDNVVQYKYDQNKLVEKISYKNFYEQPLGKTYIEKYLYRDNLLIETRYYYGTDDSSGFFAKMPVYYNGQKQKIKEEYFAYNDDGVNETRSFNWKDHFTYVEKRITASGHVERHFVKLDAKGNQLELQVYKVGDNVQFTNIRKIEYY
jgi:hypothetical protein